MQQDELLERLAAASDVAAVVYIGDDGYLIVGGHVRRLCAERVSDAIPRVWFDTPDTVHAVLRDPHPLAQALILMRRGHMRATAGWESDGKWIHLLRHLAETYRHLREAGDLSDLT